MDIEAIWNGDSAAWHMLHPTLYGVATNAISRYARSIGVELHGSVISDLAEESIEVAYLRIAAVTKVESSLLGYVAGVAFNKARSKIRDLENTIEGESLSADQTPGGFDVLLKDEPLKSNDPRTILMKVEAAEAIRALFDPADVELVLADLDGVPQKETAADRGWGVKSVSNRTKQALQRMRKIVQSHPRVAVILEELGVILPSDE